MVFIVLGEKCESNNMHLDCPGVDQPYDFTRCCIHENSTDVYCCEDPLHAKSNKYEKELRLKSDNNIF